MSFVEVMEQAPGLIVQAGATKHPFAALSEDEIRAAAGLIRRSWPPTVDIHFKELTLLEPPKSEVVRYLDAQRANQRWLPNLSRKARATYYFRNTSRFHEAVVDINNLYVESNVRLGKNVHAAADGAEITAIEQLAVEHEAVQKELKRLNLPEGTVVVCDPWIYGSDGANDDERMYQCFLYTRDPANPTEEDSNHYAFPLPISPVISAVTMKLIRIDHLPTNKGRLNRRTSTAKQRPPNEYLPKYQKLRTDLKPLNVVQPEGVSFSVTEDEGINVLQWQKWHMRISFNHREGMVLHDVRYDDRPLFYRLSLSEMNIPYADPRAPFHRKSAFDLGDTGAGMMANNLKLGCDCLGSIYYLSGLLANDKGEPYHMPNVVCVHEQDAGIGWKHTNYRTGRAAVARSRQLVVQSIITVANYEYILAFVFGQAAEMHYEVRATGILSTQPAEDGVDVDFGTIVHPGVLAVHHQHLFSLRVDPHLDGSSHNRLVHSEAHPLPLCPKTNPYGVGYAVNDTLISRSGGYDLAPQHGRVFKVQNTSSRNPINNKPVSYKIVIPPMQPILAHPTSFNARRAEFADHNIYAVRHRDGELFAGGQYTNQSRGGTGVAAWASRDEDIVDKDFVLYVQFGINHVPRVEDFPVMPCETMSVAFKPVNFFDRNPAIDVPPSEQKVNKSVGLNTQVGGRNGEAKASTTNGGENGCCSSRL